MLVFCIPSLASEFQEKDDDLLRLFRPIRLQNLWNIMGHRSLYQCAILFETSRLTLSTGVSQDTLKTTNQCLSSWCKHRVIVERIEMLSDEDLNVSGQNSLTQV